MENSALHIPVDPGSCAMKKLWAGFLGWLGRAFRRRQASNPEPRKRSRKRGETKPEVWGQNGLVRYQPQTLSELLEELPRVFEGLDYKIKTSWVDKKTLRAIYKMGPHIPWTGAGLLAEKNELVDPPSLSTLMFVAFGGRDEWREAGKECACRMMYAARQPRRAFGVSTPKKIKAEMMYECGAAYDYPGKDRLLWVNFHVAVSRTGEVEILDELCHDRVSLPGGGSYTKKCFDVPAARNMIPEDATNTEEAKEKLRFMFTATAKFWATKQYQWSVSAREKAGNRLTFSVPVKETKTYFKDREVTALAADGKKKRIIHHVKEHERKLQDGRVTTVKEHLRGIREFVWGGYECAVTAPKFHRFSASSLNVEPAYDLLPKDGMDMEELAGWLTDLEDSQAVPPAQIERGGSSQRARAH